MTWERSFPGSNKSPVGNWKPCRYPFLKLRFRPRETRVTPFVKGSGVFFRPPSRHDLVHCSSIDGGLKKTPDPLATFFQELRWHALACVGRWTVGNRVREFPHSG